MDKMNKILYCVILFFIPWLGKFLNGRTVPGVVQLILWFFAIGWIIGIIEMIFVIIKEKSDDNGEKHDVSQIERCTERVHEEQLRLASQVDDLRDEEHVEEPQQGHRDYTCQHKAPERGLLPFLEIHHIHEGRHTQQVEQVDADG